DTGAANLYGAHRVAGIALVIALVWKYAIARRSLRRRGVQGAGVWIGLLSAALTIVAAGLGLAWTLGLVSFDRPLAYSALNLHVVARPRTRLAGRRTRPRARRVAPRPYDAREPPHGAARAWSACGFVRP